MTVNLLWINFDPCFVQANLVCACIPTHCYQHLTNTETGGLVLIGDSVVDRITSNYRTTVVSTHSVVLSLDDFVAFCGFGRHLQPARRSCFQLLYLTHKRSTAQMYSREIRPQHGGTINLVTHRPKSAEHLLPLV